MNIFSTHYVQTCVYILWTLQLIFKVKILELNHQNTQTYELIIMVKACFEPATLFERTNNRKMVQTLQTAPIRCEFRIFLLHLLPTRVSKLRLLYYLIHISGKKRWIHNFPNGICAKVNLRSWNLNSTH